MTCPREQARLSAWIDGELEASEAREVASHVGDCASCRGLVRTFHEMRTALRAELEPDPGFVVRFRERRDQVSIAPWWTWRQLALRLVPVALGAMVLAWLAVSTAAPGAGPELQALEVEALGNPTPFDPDAPLAAEPVLSIALGPFPEEVP